MQPIALAEFSRPVLVDGLTAKGKAFAAAADTRERAALAARLGVLEVERLEVEGVVDSVRGGTVVQLSAHLSAAVMQSCVVSLAPVRQRIEVDFVRLFAPDAPGDDEAVEDVHFDEAGDDIDPLREGRIDVGETAAEQLALELDPYPRAPDADRMLLENDPRQDPVADSPFTKLRKLSLDSKPRKKSK